MEFKIPPYEWESWLWRKRMQTWFGTDFDVALAMKYGWETPKDKKWTKLQVKKGRGNKKGIRSILQFYLTTS